MGGAGSDNWLIFGSALGMDMSRHEHRRTHRRHLARPVDHLGQVPGVHRKHRHAEFSGQLHDPVVVVADPLPAEVEARPQDAGLTKDSATHPIGGLQDDDVDAPAMQLARRRRPRQTGAHHRNLRVLHAGPSEVRSGVPPYEGVE